MNKILWIGCFASDKDFNEMSKKGYNLASAQVSQKNLINGIEEASGCIIDTLNEYVLPPYPQYADKVIERKEWSHRKGAADVSVGYQNIKYYNHISSTSALVKETQAWALNHRNEKKLIVFVYSMRSPVMKAAKALKKIIPSAKVFLIVTDLPQFMDLGMSKMKALLKRIDWVGIQSLMKSVDGYVLYTRHMAVFLNIPNGMWMLMEGTLNLADVPQITVKQTQLKKIVVMYSGIIEKRYGIHELLDAFSLIENPDYELWITGGGNAAGLIEERAKTDGRIKYFGFLPSRQDVLKKQQQASMLINMRLPNETASAYCFPSKIFEYMASGRPVLSFKIDGIPEEYFDFMIEIEEVSKQAIKKAIEKVGCMTETERVDLGSKAREFVVNNKNTYVQAENIMNFVGGKYVESIMDM